MLDSQDKRLIGYIESKPCVTPERVAAHFQVSERTIRTYVHKANEKMGSAARIVKHRGDGYELIVDDEAALALLREDASAGGETIIPSTHEGRVSYLLNDLLSRTGWITLDELSSILFVSRNVISNDLKEVSEKLGHFDLQLEKRPHYGIRVIGSEASRRMLLASLVIDELAEFDDEGGSQRTIGVISRTVERVLSEESFSINSACHQNLVVHIAIAVMRIRENCYVPMESESLERVHGRREHEVALRIAEGISADFQIELPEEEVAYIAIHLMGKRSIYDANDSSEEGLVISDEVWETVSEMLEVVWNAFHFDFRNDIELRMNLARHIVPLAVRLRYRMNLENPLLPDIKLKYPLAYSMALDSSSVLVEHYGGSLSDDEVGYLALAFALAIERKKTEMPKKNILVVCASGQGSAKLLEWTYRQEFGAMIDTVTACDVSHIDSVDFTNIDYVFTTVPIGKALPVPVREVKYFLDEGDIKNVRELLREDDSQGSLLGHFDGELFLPHLQASNKTEVIDALCELIATKRDVPDNFRDLVYAREQAAQTSFGNQVAMPHPFEAVTQTTFVCVGLLDKPVDWNGKPVRAVFLVSISKSKNRNLDRFYRAMARLLTSEEAIQRLVNEQSWETLLKLLCEYGNPPEKGQ